MQNWSPQNLWSEDAKLKLLGLYQTCKNWSEKKHHEQMCFHLNLSFLKLADGCLADMQKQIW